MSARIRQIVGFTFAAVGVVMVGAGVYQAHQIACGVSPGACAAANIIVGLAWVLIAACPLWWIK